MVKAIEWCGDSVRFIDQTQLPLNETYIQTDDYLIIAEAIRELKIRGAPLIGVAAAYGVALASCRFVGRTYSSFSQEINRAIEELASTRPTAVNLFWALDRMKKIINESGSVDQIRKTLIKEAINIHREDEEMCRRIGENGNALIPANANILTHCNTGALATGGAGTAQSIITTAHEQGKVHKVYVDETRPLLQGARLTTWELMKVGIDVILITDSMAAFLMQQKRIDLVVVGADRIAANGDVANKIGTYSVAIAAKHHGIPFYVAAPTSTIDPAISCGDKIHVEERNGIEITEGFGKRTAPLGVNVYSPAFDITPASLVNAIITDRGIFYPPFNFNNYRSAAPNE